MDIRARARSWKAALPAVFLAMKDPETPLPAKALAALAVGYALSPIDLIPDVIPVLGYLDDLLLLPLLIALAVRLIPPPVWERSQAAARGLWAQGRPKRWLFALPIIALWGILLALIWRIL